jgi:carbonic anhydrase/acetyltransferase-like protein (isoleucine patch superfamily)
VLHACTVKDYVLIGMGAVLLDDCVVEPWSIVAAGSLVRQGFTVPSGMLVAGVPAKVMRPITDDERRNIEESPENYVRYSQNYREEEKQP